MIGSYRGYVAGADPLHGFLAGILCNQLGVHVRDPAFRVFGLAGSNEVYGYEEKSSKAQLICKFYGPKFGWDKDKAAWMAYREYEGLEILRRYNLVGSPHHVIRPLGFDRDINSVLAVEYYAGEQLSSAIDRSIHWRDDAHLFWRLKALAFYLATQHNRTASGSGADFGADTRYFDQIVGALHYGDRVGQWDVEELSWLRDQWHDRPAMWQDQEVWLHGDATPANFLFGQGLDVAAIDLERMRRGDRMFDVGRVAGELQHAYMRATGDWRRAEPFIGHFLWEYSCHFPDRDAAFASITARAPYYMGLNLLRIARNDYIGPDYRAALVGQAKTLLRAF
jgi:hypothetical protein